MKRKGCFSWLYILGNTSSAHRSIILLWIVLQPLSGHTSGFRITNQSLGAVGLAGTHTASLAGPDANYYNPAALLGLEQGWHVETSLTFLQLPAIVYHDQRSWALDGNSEKELFVMPLLHLASPQYGKFRTGFSLTSPFGLAKQWQTPFPQAQAQEFSLFVMEANPNISYAATPWLNIAGGLRCLYADGTVRNRILNPPFSTISPLNELNRYTEGTDTALGYDVALQLKATKNVNIAATYRSEVDLELDGHSTLQALIGSTTLHSYASASRVAIHLPAVLSLATAYTIGPCTIELGWDRTFWSSFSTLDFDYEDQLTGTVFSLYDQSSEKNWHDSDAFRVGVTYLFDDAWLATVGIAYDQTPVPETTLGFELPDADAIIYAVGLQYRLNKATQLGLSYMYHHTQSRRVTQSESEQSGPIVGTFDKGGAHALTLGLITHF